MRVKTNLKPSELVKVGVGLKKLAAKQQRKAISTENPAERELIRQVDAMFDIAINSLQDEISRILLDKEQ